MTGTRRSLTALALALLVLLGVASAASAQPVVGPAGLAFYAPPTTLPAGGPGTLIWYRPTTLNLNVTLPAVNAWDVLYKSTDELGNSDVVTGTVVVPTAAWTGTGPRPVIDYAIGTQGLAQSCAPSLEMAAGTEYDGGAVIASLKKGYAVVVTDYQGYTQGAVPTYTAGAAEAHAVLDIERAARQLPGSGIVASAPTIVWGYSQGGQAAGWAGQLQPTYAPDIDLVGVAAGGTPGNLQALADFGDGSVVAGFLADAIIGLNAAYPGQINLDSLANPTGLAAISQLEGECAIQSLSDFHDDHLSQFTVNNESFDTLEQQHPAIQQIVNAQQLGTMPIHVPVYHYHGLQDEFVPVSQDVALHRAWCSLGVTDDFILYPGDHLLTDPTAIPDVMTWIVARFAGQPAPSTCSLHTASSPLPATARLTPETGDLIIPLPDWRVSGSVTAAKLRLALPIPAGTTLDATADLTTGTFTAALTVPTITESFSLLGIPIVGLSASLDTVGATTGTVGLSNSGVLTLAANGQANLSLNSISIFGVPIPVGCHTQSPISLALDVSDPVNVLSSGAISLNTTTTIPPFSGCGIFGAFIRPLVTFFISGPNNPLNLSAAPPPGIPF